MQCKCSLDNNYEIIGLCDLDKFNEIISKFQDNSWTQLKLADIIDIPIGRPNIFNISKTYIDIKIKFTEIVDTPKSNTINIEGLKLTGKILLVHGEINQNIVYVSDNTLHSIHSFNFKSDFNTYIVLDSDVDINLNKYCVYPCIEDVFLRPLNNTTLARSISLLLFAHRIDNIINISNELIFKNYNNDDEIVRVGFDIANDKLMVKSTNNPYTPIDEDQFLAFELWAADQTTIKARGVVKRNENGSNFVKKLNNKKFEVNGLVFISRQNLKNTILTNYPNNGDEYDMNYVGDKSFIITDQGVVPYRLLNVISLKALNGKSVANIGFEIFSKTFLANEPISEFTNPAYANETYFEVIVRNPDLQEKFSGDIQGNNIGFILINKLFGQCFEFNDLIQLNYKEAQQVEITNFPQSGSPIYNPFGSSEMFEITRNGLITTNRFFNEFIFKNFIGDSQIVRAVFDMQSKTIIATSKGSIYNSIVANQKIELELKDSTGNISKAKGTVLQNQDGKNFAIDLNNISFQTGDLIFINYQNDKNTKLEKYPKNYQNITMDFLGSKVFKITSTDIVPHILPNIITLKSVDNKDVFNFGFDIFNKYFLVRSTGIFTNPAFAGIEYIRIIVKRQDSKERYFTLISGNESAFNVALILDKQFFDYGYTITISCAEPDRIDITNFSGKLIYHPSRTTETYTITQNGLIK